MPTRVTPPDDSTIHVYLRGARGLPIAEDESDYWAFLDAMHRANRGEGLLKPGALFLPGAAAHEAPLVDVLSFCVLQSHYHLQLGVRSGAAASKFMQRLGSSLTTRWHLKRGTTGRLFEASYRVRVSKNENQARITFAYISVLNAAEAAGVDRDEATPDELIAAAASYRFSSLPDYYLGRRLPIVTTARFLEAFPNLAALRDFVALRPRRQS